MITRRQLLQGAAAFVAAGTMMGGYAFAIEPYRIFVRRYQLTPRGWPKGLRLRIAALADIHTCEPWVPPSRVAEIVANTNALEPDICVLLGDFVSGHRLVQGRADKAAWTAALAELNAPLGTFAVLGNHDWWEEAEHQYTRTGPTLVGTALEAAGIPVLENDALRLTHNGEPFWLLGLGDQWAFYLDENGSPRRKRFGFTGVDDLPGTLDQIKDDAPAILLAHEPDIFPEVPARVALTLSGHTHGGQVSLAGWTPIVPSRYGTRYVYGHVTEADPASRTGAERHLIVSGGLGCSGFPIRFGRPPEITLIELGA